MAKVIADAIVLGRLNWLRGTRPLWAFFSSLILVPVPMLFFVSYLVPDKEAAPRLLAGAIVFSAGMNVVLGLAGQLNADRFTYRLTLIRGCPVHPISYAAGMMATNVIRSLVGSCILLALAPVFGLDVHVSAWLFPVVILTSVSLAGLALIIGNWSPSWEVGNTLGSIAGILVGLMSPIYFPVERLPDWMEPLARLSPYTYSAQALSAILAGRSDFSIDALVLAAFTAIGLTFGVAGMRWREN